MNIVRSAFGHYEAVGNPSDADVVLGHSYGTVTTPGSANHAVALFIQDIFDGRPIFADRNLVNAFPPGLYADEVEEGKISTLLGGGTGVWGTLENAAVYMRENGYRTALLVAHAALVARIDAQAHHEKIQINTVIPEGLPEVYDKESEQIFTRSKGLWVPREILGSFVLRAQDRL